MMVSPRRKRTKLLVVSTVAFASTLLASPVVAADQRSGAPARLTYTKLLKGSSPEYLAITVAANGEATFDGRKADEPPAPRSFRLSENTTRRIFQLAEALGYFQSVDLESHRKVANLGLKTFTYEADGKRSQAQFNYTLLRGAQELADLFERIGSVEQYILTLEHAIKYDHLSLPTTLRQIQIDLGKRGLADPELMAPTLEKITSNPRFLHLAQSRAQEILQHLQNNN
jgi:hypothetical protein